MNEREQIAHFETEIRRVIARFRAEYEISVGSAIGVLHLEAHRLAAEAIIDSEDEP